MAVDPFAREHLLCMCIMTLNRILTLLGITKLAVFYNWTRLSLFSVHIINWQVLSYVSLHVYVVYCILLCHLHFHLDVLIALNHQLDAQWRKFGTFLYVNSAVMDGISKDTSDVDDCMLRLVEKWLAQEDGTGDLPRTWQTVVQAVKYTGKRQLAEKLAGQHGVPLPQE